MSARPTAATAPASPSSATLPLPLQSLPYEVIQFSPALQAAIDEVTPGSGGADEEGAAGKPGAAAGGSALDRPDFDPIAYVNELFPTEDSLRGVDERIGRLQAKVRRLDEEIVVSVREQAAGGMKGRTDLDAARTSIRELYYKLSDIRAKAEASESMVTEICRDIKTLDNGKRNLTQAIRVLRKIQMLTSGVDQLRFMLSQRQYGPAAKKLEAVSQLASEFAAFAHVRKIQELVVGITSLREEASRRVYDEFKAALEKRAPMNGLVEVCEVVDALGDTKREDFISWFCETRMEDYSTVFNEWAEVARLENVEKRYMWLIDCLKRYNESFHEIFPPAWAVPEKIAAEFCTITRLSLITILNKDRQQLSVGALVSALEQTIEFEQALVDKFEPSSPDDPATDGGDSDDDEDEDDDAGDGDAADKEKPKRKEKDAVTIAPPPKKFRGILSTVFDPYMDLYVSEEDKNTGDMLSKTLGEETWMLDDEAPNKLLASSTDLIYYMKTSMLRCMKLSMGQPLFDLHHVFRKHMHAYAGALSQHLPAEGSRMGDKEVRLICLVLNTAEFCRSRCEQFETTFRRKVVAKLKQKIDLKAEVNEYKAICSRCVKLLASLLCVKLEPAFAEMLKMPWATMDNDGDSSPYVATITTIVGSDTPVMRKWLSECPGMKTMFYSFFCDLFVTLFGQMLLDNIFKCKRIGECGARNLLLDVTCLRTMLLGLPMAGAQQTPQSELGIPAESPEIAEKAKSRFSKHVSTFIKRAENVLKIVMSPQETLVKTYRQMFPEGTIDEFQRVIDLKGLSRGEKTALTDAFVAEARAAGMTVTPKPQPSGPQQQVGEIAASAAQAAIKTRAIIGKVIDTLSQEPSRK